MAAGDFLDLGLGFGGHIRGPAQGTGGGHLADAGQVGHVFQQQFLGHLPMVKHFAGSRKGCSAGAGVDYFFR